MRFSLAGLQLKFSLVKQGTVLTLPAKGEHGRLIAKVPTARAPPGIVENEESMMRWAKTAGFEVPRTEIRRARELQGLPHRMARDTPIYVIERYDRKGPVRVHQEDFAQIIGILTEDAVSSNVPFGYGALGRIVRHVLGESGVEEYLRRLALMIASGNGDAHIKNWSVVYPDGITPRWAPLYDQVATTVWEAGGGLGPSLDLGSVRQWSELDGDAIVQLAREIDFGAAKAVGIIDQTLEALRVAWAEVEGSLPLLPEHRRAIIDHWRAVPLLHRMVA